MACHTGIFSKSGEKSAKVEKNSRVEKNSGSRQCIYRGDGLLRPGGSTHLRGASSTPRGPRRTRLVRGSLPTDGNESAVGRQHFSPKVEKIIAHLGGSCRRGLLLALGGLAPRRPLRLRRRRRLRVRGGQWEGAGEGGGGISDPLSRYV